MHEVTRTIRFCVSQRPDSKLPARNTFAAFPAMTGLGAFYELRLTCRGSAEAKTGYLINISQLDAIARKKLIPIIQDTYANAPHSDPVHLMPALLKRFSVAHPQSAWSLAWRLTPTLTLHIEINDMTSVQLAQHFEFAASHRLHVPELSDSENRAIFGKCNNPNGHGHNYQLEVAVSMPVEHDASAQRFGLPDLEEIVKTRVIDRFDHKNLNADCPEFQARNPSVENIASICFELLDDSITSAGGSLHHVTVWETAKTSCTVARQG